MRSRLDAPLLVANADYFGARVRALARAGDLAWIAVAAETLRDLDTELTQAGTELAFAELKDPVRDRLRRYGVNHPSGDHRFFPTLGVPSRPTRTRPGVDWLD